MVGFASIRHSLLQQKGSPNETQGCNANLSHLKKGPWIREPHLIQRVLQQQAKAANNKVRNDAGDVGSMW